MAGQNHAAGGRSEAIRLVETFSEELQAHAARLTATLRGDDRSLMSLMESQAEACRSSATYTPEALPVFEEMFLDSLPEECALSDLSERLEDLITLCRTTSSTAGDDVQDEAA